MTQDLTVSKTGTALALSRPPEMSPVLSKKLENFRNGTSEGTESWRPEYPVAIIDEAKAVLADIEQRMAPPPVDLMDLWLRRLRNATVAMTDVEFVSRKEMIVFTSGDLPAWVWSKEALRSAIQEFPRFFPAAGELDKLLRPRAGEMSMTRFWVKHIASARVLPPPAPEDETLKAIPPLVLPPGMRSKREAKS